MVDFPRGPESSQPFCTTMAILSPWMMDGGDLRWCGKLFRPYFSASVGNRTGDYELGLGPPTR